ncbi:DMT family transporter [Streptomyces sp. YIM 98790]|uniref:DMT family transporter n=1 Tax=Streptomyces sp. YIM 98790 TaxID=2689077 RepID=UPI0014084F7C|nr:DMT family transporter [Streptomyces sp. YIM 98790]
MGSSQNSSNPVAVASASAAVTGSTRAHRPDWRALAAATVTVCFWASAFVGIRAAAEHFSPGALALGRLLTGSAALALLLAVRRVGPPPRAAWPGILLSGLLWFGLYMVALNWGEEHVDAGTAALLVNIGPIVIALLAGRLLGEGMPPRLLAGLAVSFAGAAVVGLSMSGGGTSGASGAAALGVVLCLVAALTYAGGVVAQKPALRHASALQVTAYGCFTGTAACLPFAGQFVTETAAAPLSATAWVVYLGVFPTALAFVTWAYALSRTTAGRMGATTYAVPALVVLMSWAVLQEVPGRLTLLGGVLCLAGVALSRSRSLSRSGSATRSEPEPEPGSRPAEAPPAPAPAPAPGHGRRP